MEWAAPFIVRRDEAGAIALPVLVFDGSCGFCTWAVRSARTADRGSRVNYIAHQFLSRAEFTALGVEPNRCGREVVFVDAQRSVLGGARAVNAYALASGWALARFAARLRLPPPLLALEAAAYRWIARHRITISRLLGTAGYALIDASVESNGARSE